MIEEYERIDTRAGFVAIIGKPNAGKSSLMNSIVGEKLSIVTPKPQTTRKRVLGIYSDDDTQIVFTDTPGVLKPRYEMQTAMMEYVNEAIDSSDVLLVIFDVADFKPDRQSFHQTFIDTLKRSDSPKILLLNKIDLIKDKKLLLPMIFSFGQMNIFNDIVPISALEDKDSVKVVDLLKSYLPESPFYYDEEMLSTQSQRFFVSELIREQIFKAYDEEIPYSTEVMIAEFKERENGKWYIAAEIIIERDSQKGIIIGKGGEKLKSIGEKSRIAIEDHLDLPVFLDLFVKVRENWRSKKSFLKSFGY